MVGMADGYAQATGRPALVNLHTAPGVGNAMGAIFNAHQNKAPLVITAGQQVRPMMSMEALLTNPDPVVLPRPFVKWSYEPPRPQDVPAALARAYHLAQLPPLGPVFVSVPMDDWSAEADEVSARQVTGRATTRPCRARPGRAGGSRAPARGRVEPGAGRRPRRRRRRRARLGRGRRAGRAVPAARVGAARLRLGTRRVPRGPSQLPGPAAAGDRACGPDPGAVRPGARGRCAGVHLLPVHPGPGAAGGDVARAGHERSAGGRPRACGGRDRGGRGAHARGAARACRDPGPPASRGAAGTRAPARVEPDRRCGGDGGARRGAPRRGHRRERVTLEHDRVPQSGAPVAPVELLHGRRRRARLRAARRGRHATRAAGAAGGRRDRRRVAAVRGRRHCGARSPTTSRSPCWCCATRSTRS